MTVIVEYDGHQKIEYRRAGRALPLEGRMLTASGHPYDGNWYPVDAGEWLTLQRHSPDTLRALLPELVGSETLTPRG